MLRLVLILLPITLLGCSQRAAIDEAGLVSSCKTVYASYDGSLAADHSVTVERDCACAAEKLAEELSPERFANLTKSVQTAATNTNRVDLEGMHGLEQRDFDLLQGAYGSCATAARQELQDADALEQEGEPRLDDRFAAACTLLMLRPDRPAELSMLGDAVIAETCGVSAFVAYHQYSPHTSAENKRAMAHDVEALEGASTSQREDWSQYQRETIERLELHIADQAANSGDKQ